MRNIPLNYTVDSELNSDSTLRLFTLRGHIKGFDYNRLDAQISIYKASFLIALTHYLDLKYGKDN